MLIAPDAWPNQTVPPESTVSTLIRSLAKPFFSVYRVHPPGGQLDSVRGNKVGRGVVVGSGIWLGNTVAVGLGGSSAGVRVGSDGGDVQQAPSIKVRINTLAKILHPDKEAMGSSYLFIFCIHQMTTNKDLSAKVVKSLMYFSKISSCS